MSRETKFLKLVKKFVKRHSTLTEVSAAISPSGDKTLLSKALNGHRPFTFQKLERVLEVLNVEPDQFFGEFLAQEIGYATDTAGRLLHTLRAARSGNAPRSRPPEILSRIESVLPDALTDGSKTKISDRFEYTAGLLGNDRQVALAEAETWLLELWSSRLKRKPWSDESTAELCVALAAWAMVTRSLGKSQEAGFALELALHLLIGVPLAKPFGPVLEVSARVVSDLGQPSLGFDCLREALSLYSIFQERAAAARTMISIGLFATYRGMFEVAESAFMQCTRDPNLSHHLRNIAIKNLSWSWLKSGRTDKARWLISEVEVEHLPARTRFNLEWIESLILSEEGSLEQAAEKFALLFEEGEEHLIPADRLLLFMDYCHCLALLGRIDDILARTPEMMTLAKNLESTPLVRELALEALALVEASVDAIALEEAAARFKRSLQPGAAATQPL